MVISISNTTITVTPVGVTVTIPEEVTVTIPEVEAEVAIPEAEVVAAEEVVTNHMKTPFINFHDVPTLNVFFLIKLKHPLEINAKSHIFAGTIPLLSK